MAYGIANADGFASGRRISLSGTTALMLAAFVMAAGAAAWIANVGSTASASIPVAPDDSREPSFEARFSARSAFDPQPLNFSPRPLVESFYSEVEVKLQEAKARLARKLQSGDWKTALLEDSSPSTSSISAPAEQSVPPAPSTVTTVPLPKSRPVEAASAELQSGSPPPAVQADSRTLFQKLADVLPTHLTLASLAPDGGLPSDGPDLTSLGYESFTAVYDISAHVVYMPNGSKLEAHSGIGALMDDPEHVSERMVGATPPTVYDLKPRERLFHGVPALRMIPVDSRATLGRSGLLAHSYMLGPNGDSNGCVSIKNYERFLKAFQNGEIKRLVVVPSLGGSATASGHSTSQS
jgi:Protein of unknown function (DUF2778)